MYICLNSISVQTKMQAFYFQWHIICASRANKVILFDINKATYCEQTNHFNVCKCIRLASDIQSFQNWTERKSSFPLEILAKLLPWLPGLSLDNDQSRSFKKSVWYSKYIPIFSVLSRNKFIHAHVSVFLIPCSFPFSTGKKFLT